MDWTTPLRSQQADFIQRLKSGHLLHCDTQGQHSELTVISGERLKQLRDFCWEMAEKYKRTSPVRDVFINNLKGKLGEEVVKVRLADLVTEVDYEQRLGGDGKVDFRLACDPSIGIQVKARHGTIDSVRWSITKEEIEQNAALICILIQEEVNEAQSKYNLIMAGFLPMNLIKESSKASFKIDELLYSGGLRSYLDNLDSLEFDDLLVNILKRKEEGQNYEQNQAKFISVDAQIKAYNYLSVGIDRYYDEECEMAIENFSEAISLNPKLTEAYYLRGDCHRELKNAQGAIEDYTQALLLTAQDAAEFYYSRGSTRFYSGDNQVAIDDFNQAIRLNPNLMFAYYERGKARSAIGDHLAAIEDFNQVIRLKPEAGAVYYDRSKAYSAIGNEQKAIEDLKKHDENPWSIWL